jgi:hypothetical protein
MKTQLTFTERLTSPSPSPPEPQITPELLNYLDHAFRVPLHATRLTKTALLTLKAQRSLIEHLSQLYIKQNHPNYLKDSIPL